MHRCKCAFLASKNLRIRSNKIGSTKVCHFHYFCFLIFFFSILLKIFFKGDKSKRLTQSDEEQSEQLSERDGEASERSIERKLTDVILSLQAEVTKLGKIINKRKRKQKETEKLFKKMIEEWEEMKPQFQDIVNIPRESKYQLAKIIVIRPPCF